MRKLKRSFDGVTLLEFAPKTSNMYISELPIDEDEVGNILKIMCENKNCMSGWKVSLRIVNGEICEATFCDDLKD